MKVTNKVKYKRWGEKRVGWKVESNNLIFQHSSQTLWKKTVVDLLRGSQSDLHMRIIFRIIFRYWKWNRKDHTSPDLGDWTNEKNHTLPKTLLLPSCLEADEWRWPRGKLSSSSKSLWMKYLRRWKWPTDLESDKCLGSWKQNILRILNQGRLEPNGQC